MIKHRNTYRNMYDELKTDKSLLGWFSLWGYRFQVLIFIPPRLRCSSGLLHPVIGLPPPIGVSEIFLWPLQTCCQCFLHIWRLPLWAWTSPQGWSCLGWILKNFPHLIWGAFSDIFIHFLHYFTANCPRNSFSNLLDSHLG